MGNKAFYIVFAYPTTSGTLHVGHIRSYTLPDIIAKYHISKGEQVFFPIGFHATGADAIKIFDAIKADPSKSENYGISKEAISKIKEPADVVKALGSYYIKLFKEAGFSANYEAAISTIDPAYKKFIGWQFRKLYKLGYLIQKDYQLPWCPRENQPVHLDASEADIVSFKGSKVVTYNLVIFDGDLPLMGYTKNLGILNGPVTLEINSKAKYIEANLDGKRIVASEEAMKKLLDLDRNVKKIRELSIDSIEKAKTINPITKEPVKIIKSELDTSDGTDIRIVGKLENEKANQKIYDSAGEEIYKKLKNSNKIDQMQDLSEKPVYCRCGAEVVVKNIKNQWFIDYGNKEWKKQAKKLVANISTFPQSYKNELDGIIDWLGPRPCVRRTGLGTEFPFEKGWIIEALSDSTIYMAMYIIAKALNAGKIKVDSLNDELFDYVFLGIGALEKVSSSTGIDPNTLNGLRIEFENTYPLDVNFGGVEHKAVHFPFFIFNHAAIFPEQYWPKAIFLNWHVISNGEKMSKHLGNYVSWEDALDRYGVDAVRLYISSGADQWSIFDWSNKAAEEAKKNLEKFVTQSKNLIKQISTLKEDKHTETIFDRWLISKLNSSIQKVTTHLDNYEIRPAIVEALYRMNAYLEAYLAYDKINKVVLQEFLTKQLLLLYPFVPITSTNLLAEFGIDKTKIRWPNAEKDKIDKGLERIFDSLGNTVKDINQIKKLQNKKTNGTSNKCYIYVLTDKEKEVYSEAKERLANATGFEEISVYKVDEAGIYDPENRASKAKPFKPAIFIQNTKA